MIINIVGAPCHGKSTLACELFVALKKKHINTEYINEFAKTLIWQNREDEISDQFYVARKQYQIIKDVHDHVEIAICDSPLFISLFYNEYNLNNMSNVEKTRNYILDKMKEFEPSSYYIFLSKNENLPYTNVGRIHTEQESKKINVLMKEMLYKYNIPYMTHVVGEDDISKIVEQVEMLLDID